MKPYAKFYPLLNGIFHLVHGAVIVFVAIGWAFPSLRLAHLVLVLLTLASWFILGQWLGIGYCPISSWHWKIKQAAGEGAPDATYIRHVLQKILRWEVGAEAVDKVVLIGTFLIAILSLYLNVAGWTLVG